MGPEFVEPVVDAAEEGVSGGVGAKEGEVEEDDEDRWGSDHLFFDEEFFGVVVVVAFGEFGHQRESDEVGAEVDGEVDEEESVKGGDFGDGFSLGKRFPEVRDEQGSEGHGEGAPTEPLDFSFEDRVDDGGHDEHTASHQEHGEYDGDAVDGIGEGGGDDDQSGADAREEDEETRSWQREGGGAEIEFPLGGIFPPFHA